MIGAYIILGTMIAFAVVIAVIELLGRRNDRQSRDHTA